MVLFNVLLGGAPHITVDYISILILPPHKFGFDIISG